MTAPKIRIFFISSKDRSRLFTKVLFESSSELNLCEIQESSKYPVESTNGGWKWTDFKLLLLLVMVVVVCCV